MRTPFRLPVYVVACLASILLSTRSPAQADSFTVDQWGLNISIYQYPDLLGDSYMTVTNPFSAAHQVTLPSNPATFAAAQYDISWLVNYGSFNIAAQLAAQDVGALHVTSVASGAIYVLPSSDLTVVIDAAFTYDLPIFPMQTVLHADVFDVQSHQPLFWGDDAADTFDGTPVAGTLGVSGQALLPANREVALRYNIYLDCYGDSHTVASGIGQMNFTITPEPTSLALLAAGGLLCRPRRMSRVTAPIRRIPIA